MKQRSVCGRLLRRVRSVLLLSAPKRPGTGNAFEVLGVSPEASLEEIKQAYLYFARLYHPDVNPNGHDEFARVNQAYMEATKRGDYTRLKLKCDVVEAKAAHAEFLRLVLRIKTLTGIEIPPVPPSDMSKRKDAGDGAKLAVAMLFRCPVCKWKKECDRATGFGEVEGFHREFMRKAINI
jgi:hypothetical protein